MMLVFGVWRLVFGIVVDVNVDVGVDVGVSCCDHDGCTPFAHLFAMVTSCPLYIMRR